MEIIGLKLIGRLNFVTPKGEGQVEVVCPSWQKGENIPISILMSKATIKSLRTAAQHGRPCFIYKGEATMKLINNNLHIQSFVVTGFDGAHNKDIDEHIKVEQAQLSILHKPDAND